MAKAGANADSRTASAAIVLEYLLKLGALSTAELLDEKLGSSADDTAAFERLQAGLSDGSTASEATVLEAMCMRAVHGRGKTGAPSAASGLSRAAPSAAAISATPTVAAPSSSSSVATS